MSHARYWDDDVDLMRGSIDDIGDARYVKPTQNVPDGFVFDLQTDLNALEFTEAGTPDGAFGKDTKRAVQAFQTLAELDPTGIVDGATRAALKEWVENGHTKRNPPAGDGAPSAPAGGPTYIEPRVPHFSQGDARWAARVLGRGSTLQRAGCAISCISMILKHRGRSVDPGTLDEYLDANGGYQGDSVVWGVAAGCGAEGHSRVTYGRFEGAEAQVRAKLEERLAEGRPTMVRVDYGTDDDLRYNHFVLAVGRTADGRILMNDPGTRFGDAYVDAGPDNVIETTSRKRGYRMVQLDWYD